MKDKDLLMKGLTGYITDLLPVREEVFQEIEVLAEKNEFPIVGPQVGQFLMFISRLMGAKRVLELGSGFGYSALWFAKGIQQNAEIICTDGSESNAEKAKRYFVREGVEDKITFLVGSSIEIMNDLEGEFDIIFNDIDKEEYPDAYRTAVPRLRTGGLLITDNTLWSGRVLNKELSLEAHTKGVLEYNNLAFSDASVISVILPVRDGLTISYKL